MIAKLAGILDTAGPDSAILDVGGVGYLVFCSTRTIERLPPSGGTARLLIETHVREDHIHLYGFIDAAERGLPVAEYSANMVKKSVVGAGHAEKEQVQMMVRRLLPGCAIAEPDAADALAVAICHAHHAGTVRRWSETR